MKFGVKKFKIEYLAKFNSQNKNDIRIWISKPLNSKYQKIKSLTITPKPFFAYEEKKNQILYFEFKKMPKLELKIKINAILKNSKFKMDNKRVITQNQNYKLFKIHTKSEKFLEQTPDLKQLTYNITKNCKNPLDEIISISKFLKKNFKYVYPVKTRGVKNLNLQNLKGDCGEVGALFITMCRILKIPAINKTGYVIYYDELSNIYEHGWTSVYMNNIGWLDIDPLAQNIKKHKNQYIYEQKNYFLAFLNEFNIRIKPPIPKNHKINYWEDSGLPITRNSSQIIQPLIFSSKNKLNFKESIKLIK